MSVRFMVGDVFEKLRELPDESVHCVISSPPYWGLRCYGVEGQIGLEPTLGEHIDVIVKVFSEVRRVLRKDGTVWLNYGDCYATAPNGRSAADTKTAGNDDRTFRDKPFSTVGPIYNPNHYSHDRRVGAAKQERNTGQNIYGAIEAGGVLKPKDLCMVPNRIAIALQEDGWWVRSEIIWAKPNPMPESITDRPGTSHEKVFLLTKAERYFYDAEAVREACQSGPSDLKKMAEGKERIGGKHKNSDDRFLKASKHTNIGQKRSVGDPSGRNLRNVWDIAIAGFGGEYCRACSTYFAGPDKKRIRVEKIKGDQGDVMTIRHCPCGETDQWLSHFATFPPALVEPCIKAGTSEKGVCPDCGTPWVRQVERGLVPTAKAAKTFVVDGRDEGADGNDQGSNRQKDGHKPGYIASNRTTGWEPGCEHDYGDGYPLEPVPATVLDPFGGAGTTALVSDRLGRNAVLIELNPDYAAMARKRIESDGPLFADLTGDAT